MNIRILNAAIRLDTMIFCNFFKRLKGEESNLRETLIKQLTWHAFCENESNVTGIVQLKPEMKITSFYAK